MPYSDLYIHASDFDWFIFGDKIKIHAASAGGEVPKVIQNNIKRNSCLLYTSPSPRD